MDPQLIAFTAVAASMVAMPGVDFAVVVRNALVSRRAGVACAFGIAAGLLVHTALAVGGVAAVLVAVPSLFRALQLVGGAYVIHLGYRALRAAARGPVREPAPDPATVAEPAPGTVSGAERGTARATAPLALTGAKAGLRQGFLTNVLNPKAAITFLSVLPQFVPDGSPVLPRTALLAAIVVILALLWFPTVALLVDRLGAWLRRPRTARALETAMGVTLMTLGLFLLTEPLIG